MAIVTVKNKYQVVIPLSVRDPIAEGLEDAREGRVRGPFNTVDEMLDSLKGRKSSAAKKPRASTK